MQKIKDNYLAKKWGELKPPSPPSSAAPELLFENCDKVSNPMMEVIFADDMNLFLFNKNIDALFASTNAFI